MSASRLSSPRARIHIGATSPSLKDAISFAPIVLCPTHAERRGAVRRPLSSVKLDNSWISDIRKFNSSGRTLPPTAILMERKHLLNYLVLLQRLMGFGECGLRRRIREISGAT